MSKHEPNHEDNVNNQNEMGDVWNYSTNKENTMGTIIDMTLEEKQNKRDTLQSVDLFDARIGGDAEREQAVLLEMADLTDQIIKELGETSKLEQLMAKGPQNEEVLKIVFDNLVDEEKEWARDIHEQLVSIMEEM